MLKRKTSFTLIELVMVIIILAILAAIAISKYTHLKSDARAGGLPRVVGQINSASAINYAARSANSTRGIATIGLTCQTAADALLQGGTPAGYTLPAIVISAGMNTCPVTQTSGDTMNAFIFGI
jgi:MSHA pilin protein MshA